MEDLEFREEQIDEIKRCIVWLMSKNTWEDQKQDFRTEIARLDRLREEDFRVAKRVSVVIRTTRIDITFRSYI